MVMSTKQKFYGRHLLTLMDYTGEEIAELLELSAKLKQERASGKEVRRLEGLGIALIFEKDSTQFIFLTFLPVFI